jgi:hypothetical protein
LEVSFPDLVFDRSVPVFDKGKWNFTGKWEVYQTGAQDKRRDQSMWSGNAGDEAEISFTGTGISINGNWWRDCGKADIYVDGNLDRSIDTYYYFANQQHTESIWHVTNLAPGDHKVKIIIKGENRPEATGTRIYLTSATIFRTEPKKSEGFRFSFE